MMEVGRGGKLQLSLEQSEPSPKPVDLRPLYNFTAERGSKQFSELQERLREWQERYDDGTDFLLLPEMDSGVRGFSDSRHASLREFYEWLSCCALKVAAVVQANYRKFRAERGVVTFDDQIALALELTNNREAISRIRANHC